MVSPKIIKLNKVTPFEGKEIIIYEKELLISFCIKRIYWIKFNANEINFSEHAHKTLKQIIIPLEGEISISLEDTSGNIYNFLLNNSTEGLYIPEKYWKKIEYKKPCNLLCLASEEYNENDYIRTYEDFKQFQK